MDYGKLKPFVLPCPILWVALVTSIFISVLKILNFHLVLFMSWLGRKIVENLGFLNRASIARSAMPLTSKSRRRFHTDHTRSATCTFRKVSRQTLFYNDSGHDPH